MIFVTVGSDIPFDRLVRTVDRWAGLRDRRDVFAQIGHGGWRPGFIEHSAMLEPAEFTRRLAASRIVIGHAGMGTILSALQYSKPVLVMPRRGALGETRNDHQLATARQLMAMNKIRVAFDDDELFESLDRIDHLTPDDPIMPHAEERLIRMLRDFIHARMP
jgi:UDP-N-acetylglucosamine transferase subunit ALG13